MHTNLASWSKMHALRLLLIRVAQYVQVFEYICMRIGLHVYIYIYMCIYMNIYLYMQLCYMRAFTYIYAYMFNTCRIGRIEAVAHKCDLVCTSV